MQKERYIISEMDFIIARSELNTRVSPELASGAIPVLKVSFPFIPMGESGNPREEHLIEPGFSPIGGEVIPSFGRGTPEAGGGLSLLSSILKT